VSTTRCDRCNIEHEQCSGVYTMTFNLPYAVDMNQSKAQPAKNLCERCYQSICDEMLTSWKEKLEGPNPAIEQREPHVVIDGVVYHRNK